MRNMYLCVCDCSVQETACSVRISKFYFDISLMCLNRLFWALYLLWIIRSISYIFSLGQLSFVVSHIFLACDSCNSPDCSVLLNTAQFSGTCSVDWWCCNKAIDSRHQRHSSVVQSTYFVFAYRVNICTKDGKAQCCCRVIYCKIPSYDKSW